MTKFEPIHAERLTILAERLESGQALGIGIFDFSSNTNCALCECPHIWPDDWTFGNWEPLLPGRKLWSTSAAQWFGTTKAETLHLFTPGCQRPKFGCTNLLPTATRQEVAASYRAFLEYKRGQAQ